MYMYKTVIVVYTSERLTGFPEALEIREGRAPEIVNGSPIHCLKIRETAIIFSVSQPLPLHLQR